jgi:hypothetical protein
MLSHLRATLLTLLSETFGEHSAARHSSAVLRTDQGFLDIDLPITAVSKVGGGTVRVTAQGSVQGGLIGLAVDLQPHWKAQPLKDSNALFYWGAGSYRSIGIESDRFVALIAKHYGQPVGPDLRMLAQVPADVVGLNDDPSMILSLPARMKFCFHTDTQARYAEVFTNIDIEAGRLEFREKDPGYRAALVRALTEV